MREQHEGSGWACPLGRATGPWFPRPDQPPHGPPSCSVTEQSVVGITLFVQDSFSPLALLHFLKVIFKKTELTYYKICPLKVYNSVVLGTFTKLCNRHQEQHPQS